MSTYYSDLFNTTFPNTVDTIVEKMDVLASDGAMIAKYQDYMQSGDYTNASITLNSIPNVSKKIITANDLNVFRDCILALERFYKDDIQEYTEEKQQEWENTIDAFAYKGSYQYVQYYKNNYVSYNNNGKTLLYLATKTPPKGTAPDNNNYWRELTIKGEKGESGKGLTFMWDWNSSDSYSTDDVVIHNNIVWGCRNSNTNSEPEETNTSYWEKLMTISPEIYPVQTDEPSSKQDGELWFQEIGTIGD